MLGKNLIQAASGAAGAAGGLGIEDVFSTWLYTGNGSTQTITNGIDLSGEGGLVWIKARNTVYGHYLTDTERGAGYALSSNNTDAQVYSATAFVSGFNADGFSLGNSSSFNDSGRPYASWTFRKAPGFFDIVTFTSNGASSQQIAHNLGSVPGCIILKNLDNAAYGWHIYHRGVDPSVPEQYGLKFTTAERNNNSGFWNNTQPTSTHFTIGNLYQGNTQNYVAYLFAHDAGGFGDDGTESVIKCGSYTGNSSTSGPVVDLGWEPQWVLTKRAVGGSGSWLLFDNMRGIATGGNDAALAANLAGPESDYPGDWLNLTSTGFQLTSSSSAINGTGNEYIYIAIRRGPMKTPTSATEVFATQATAGATDGTPSANRYTSNFPVDLFFQGYKLGDSAAQLAMSRLTGDKYLSTSSTAAEASLSYFRLDDMDGIYGNTSSGANSNVCSWMFRRAPGFFDVVAYTGTNTTRTQSHNLGVAPELMIIKRRDLSQVFAWPTYHAALGATNVLQLWKTDASVSNSVFDNTAPTASAFSLSPASSVNGSGGTYIAYLFASLPGISKVGSYTGNGSVNQIDCGFASGARFVLIKRTDSTGDWYVWDTARGIVSGNDPYLLLNSADPEVTSTDYIDPLSSGFQISWAAPAAINASGGSYIYLAIA